MSSSILFSPLTTALASLQGTFYLVEVHLALREPAAYHEHLAPSYEIMLLIPPSSILAGLKFERCYQSAFDSTQSSHMIVQNFCHIYGGDFSSDVSDRRLGNAIQEYKP